MKKETKILIGVLATLLVVTPLVIDAMATDTSQNANITLRERLRQLLALRGQQQNKQATVVWFFNGAEQGSITGTVVVRSGNILIVKDSANNRFNIILPARWNIDNKVVSLDQIDQYVSGDVTLKVLKRTATNEKGLTITAIMAYEITANGKTLYAVTPFNING